MVAAQSSHVKILAAANTQPVAGRRQTRCAAAALVPVFYRRPVLPSRILSKEPIGGMHRPTARKCQVSLRLAENRWTAPHLAIFPGLLILRSVLASNGLGDGRRDALPSWQSDIGEAVTAGQFLP